AGRVRHHVRRSRLRTGAGLRARWPVDRARIARATAAPRGPARARAPHAPVVPGPPRRARVQSPPGGAVMPTARVNGVELYYEETGQGFPLPSSETSRRIRRDARSG